MKTATAVVLGCVSVFACLSGGRAPLWAAAIPDEDASKLPVVAIQWPQKQPRPELGKMAFYKGEADALGVAFTIPAGTVFSRSAVAVKATDRSKPLTVMLKNELSTGWDRTATTDASGLAEIRYRTEGGAMVLIQSPAGRQAFELLVVQGNEIPVHKTMRPPFVSWEAYAAKQAAAGSTRAPAVVPAPAAPPPGPAPAGAQAEGTSLALWVIAGLLAAILGVGVIFLLRKRPS